MTGARIGLADIGVLALLIVLAVGTAFLQNRHQPLALYDQNIRATIGAQIEAFRAQDDVSAFAHASPDLRAQFVAPNRFMPWCGPLSTGRHGATIQLYRPRPCHIANPADTAARCLFGR